MGRVPERGCPIQDTIEKLAFWVSLHPYHVMAAVGLYWGLDMLKFCKGFGRFVVHGRCETCNRELEPS